MEAFLLHRALDRRHKRDMLRDFQIRVYVTKSPKVKGKRSKLEVVSVRLIPRQLPHLQVGAESVWESERAHP